MLLGCETSKTYVLNSEKGRAYTRKEATFHLNSSHSLTEVLEKIRSNPEVSAYENNIELGSLDLTQPLLLNMKSLGTALVAVSSSLSYVVAGTHEIWWNITYLNANPDGLYERRVIGINGTWPPPPIEVSSNDTLLVHAFNSLDVPTSLHHHGMFFPNRTHFDGAVGVSQCGIPPGQSFTYEVPILESAQWGTYWIHSHASGQYVDGLRGPVVIHHKDASGNSLEPHKYDEEITVVLGDWYHAEHPVNNAKFLSRWNPGGAEPVPESALIYFTANGTTVPGFNQDTTINFVPGKTYRLRVINVSALAMFHFWIDGHDMRIIEVDGTDVAEAPTPLLTLTVAQRYSVLVTARSDASQNFLVHANMDADMFDDVPPSLALNITSSITYSPGAPMAPEQTIDDYGSMPWDTTFQPVQAMTLPNPTKELELGVFFDTMDNGINRAMFNNVTWNVPVVPSTISALTMGDDASVQNVYGPNTEVVEYGEIMQMTVVNWDAGKHPFHLHGHKFAIMHRSDDVTSDDPAVNPPYNNNQANPIWRDTVQIESGGSVTLRWQADNPGAWIFHCHIEWHLEAGLASRFLPAWVFLESPKLMQQWTKPPQYYYDHCKALGVPTSGNAAGHNSTTDLSGLTIGPFPQKLGWNAKGIGAMTGCVLSAVLGIATVAWYSMGPGKDTDED